MKKFICTICGYVYEGETAPEFCPQCKAPREKFQEQTGEKTWAAEHVVGVAKGAPVRWRLPRRPRSWASMPFTIPYMKWQGMRPGMERPSRAC